VASNSWGTVRGNDVLFRSPVVALNGAATLTNECHTALADPGATVAVAPMAIAAGSFHNMA